MGLKGMIRRYLTSLTRNYLHYTGIKKVHAKHIKELKRKGLRIGKNVMIDPRSVIDQNFPYLISIGDNSVICARVRLLAHDNAIYYNTDGYGRLGRIDIKENCIISLGSIIMPGVTIGPNVIVGAGSVVNKDIPPNTCVAGVPARFYATFDDVISKYREGIAKGRTFDGLDLIDREVPEDLKAAIIKEAEKGPVYIKNIDKIEPEVDLFTL